MNKFGHEGGEDFTNSVSIDKNVMNIKLKTSLEKYWLQFRMSKFITKLLKCYVCLTTIRRSKPPLAFRRSDVVKHRIHRP